MPQSTSPELTSASHEWKRLPTLVGVGLLMCIHFAVSFDVLRKKTPTVDEIAHLPAGLSYLEQRTFRVYPHNPPLARVITAAAAAPVAPPIDYRRAKAYSATPPNHWGFALQWLRQTFERREGSDRYLKAFTYGRIAFAVWSALTIPVLFAWARWWFGPLSSWLAAALWTLSPNIVAHSGMITTDLAAASLGVVSSFAFVRWWDRPTWSRSVIAGVLLGLAQLVKFSSLLLYGIWGLLFVCWMIGLLRGESETYAFRRTVQFVAMLVCSVFVINAGYLFEGSGARLGDFQFLSESLTRRRIEADRPPRPCDNITYNKVRTFRINRFAGTWLGRLPCPLPYFYVSGFDEQKFEAEGKYQMYLRGKFADVEQESKSEPATPEDDPFTMTRQGWWYYYLYALAVKVPLSTHLLFMIGLFAGLFRRESRGRMLTLLVFVGVPLFSMSFLTDINIGLRYTLPLFPFAFLIASASAIPTSLWIRIAVVCAVCWNAVALATIHPHELSYFNRTVGGPMQGRFHLIDSNIDWGQDLRSLAKWLETHPEWKAAPIAYFGTVPPEFEGIAGYTMAPRLLDDPDMLLPWENPNDPTTYGPQPGKFIVSVNLERGMQFHTPAPLRLQAAIIFKAIDNPNLFWPIRPMVKNKRDVYSYFQHFTPVIDPELGYSLLLYDLKPDEVNRVRKQLKLAPLPKGSSPESR